ncbi:hypothetical protein [Halococcus qingdaonensis]|uniref:hypothetical protein n=1 Tax=Halococcus qingdaonensis TaxID=224402 RepID=UPI002115E3B8|nr:hypothetical protein [Halococcus qingdaonensis]
MSGPTREDFADAIADYWHDRPPASLEDVMALYGVLAVAESGGSLYGTALLNRHKAMEFTVSLLV